MARKRAKVTYSKKEKIDYSLMAVLFGQGEDDPKPAPTAAENARLEQRAAEKKKQVVYKEVIGGCGNGILELYNSLGSLAHDWPARYFALNDNKKLGVQAHMAYEAIFPGLRAELDRNDPNYEADYMRMAYERIAEWEQVWGHIPGWWNRTAHLPRKVN